MHCMYNTNGDMLQVCNSRCMLQHKKVMPMSLMSTCREQPHVRSCNVTEQWDMEGVQMNEGKQPLMPSSSMGCDASVSRSSPPLWDALQTAGTTGYQKDHVNTNDCTGICGWKSRVPMAKGPRDFQHNICAMHMHTLASCRMSCCQDMNANGHTSGCEQLHHSEAKALCISMLPVMTA
jgi:hypothetical protein